MNTFSHLCIPAEEFEVDREILEEAYEQQHRGDIQLESKDIVTFHNQDKEKLKCSSYFP
jgi:hypothetical protein